MFLLAALLIALVQNFVVNGRSEATLVHARNSRGGPSSEVNLHQLLEKRRFRDIEVNVVSREKQSPHFETVFATGIK